MSRRPRAASLVRELGFAGLCALAACSIRPKANESQGPFLSIMLPPGDGATGAHDAIALGSVALAFGGLPPGEMTRLRDILTDSTDAAIRRAAPELFDLSGSDDVVAASSLRPLARDLPALTAAANVLGSPWVAPGISVQLGSACAASAARCVSLFGGVPGADDALVRRGRSLAWALANAAVLRVPASSRPALLRSLRELQTRSPGTVAMVFDASRGTLDVTELDLLHEQARRALAHVPPEAPQRHWLETLAAARMDWVLPVALEADQVLLVPRLSALARLKDFASEVEHAGTLEWVVRPGEARGK
jgi:hypothetical protein